jgi:pimeloyl-ACP methyl ester carboxylesterase
MLAPDPVAALDARAERFETPCGDGTMIWRVWGQGPPVVLLHGATGSWTHWLRNIRPLAARFRIYAADMPGYGDSAMPPEPYTPESLGKILADGMKRLVPMPERFDLVCFSFGGILGGHAAARLPGRVRRLVLIGSNGLGTTVPPTRPLVRMPANAQPELIRTAHRHNLGVVMIADPERIDDLAIEVQIANLARSRTRSGNIPMGDSLARVLPEVAARIAGIWGENDALSAPYIAEREAVLRAVQPDLDFRIVPGAGHWVIWEAAETVNAILADMLSQP